MIRYFAALAIVVALGAVVAVAFGADALWVYAFFALLAAATALATGLSGDLIVRWSRSRFDR
jgi:hypothetical protein